jgi:hypothetical protein
MNVADVQRAYRDANCHVPSKRRAQDIIAALPFMATATGMSEADVLEVCIVDHANGATDRLVRAHKDYLRTAGAQ